MSKQPLTTPVKDTVPKVHNEVAVGEDLRFQQKWWIFERLAWGFFFLLIICDVLGLFGQGWLAQAKASSSNGGLTVEYERIERAGTPSTMRLHFGPSTIQGGQIRVYISDSVVKGLGAQRISPQPASSAVGRGGIAYVFSATESPAEVDIQLEPTAIGVHNFRIQAASEPPIDAKVFVAP